MPETPSRPQLLPVAFSLSLACALAAQEPLPKIVLSGRVVDVLGAGVPIADVQVLDLDDGATLGRITCDGDGMFRLKLPERTAYLVRSAADGFATCSLEMTPLGGELPLVRGCTLNGRVLGPDGEPQAGAPVASITGHRVVARPEPVRTTTDASGRFELAGVPIGFNEVFARRLDGSLLYDTRRITDDTELRLMPPTSSLRVPAGVLPSPALAPEVEATDGEPPLVRPDLPFAVRMVGPDGKARSGMLVMAQVEGSHAFQLARCGADGVAAFAEPLPLGSRIVVSSRDEHWAVDRPQRLTSRFPRPPTGSCVVTVGDRVPTLLVEPACRVTVTLQDHYGKQPAGVVVHLQWERGTDGALVTFRSARTDDDGRASFAGLHPGLGTLRAQVAGPRGFALGSAFTFEPGSRELELSVPLTPATVVTGTVLDVDGTPRAATQVMMHCDDACFGSSTLSDIDGRYCLFGPGGQTVAVAVASSRPTLLLPLGAPVRHDVQMPRR